MKMLTCDHSRNRQLSPTVSIWLVLLTIVGLGLIMYGVFQEDRADYKKLNIAVGLILILCMLMFVSFLIIDTKRLRKYILHILVPWCAGITLIVIGILIAFIVQFINFKLFLITSLPLSSLAFFTFNEIYHYIGRMRVTPLYAHSYRTPRAESEADTRRTRTSSRLLHFRPDTARPRQQSTLVSPVKSPTQPGRPRVSTVTPARTPTQRMQPSQRIGTPPSQRTPPTSIVRPAMPVSSRPGTPTIQQSSGKKPILPPMTSTVNPSSPASRLRINRTPVKKE